MMRSVLIALLMCVPAHAGEGRYPQPVRAGDLVGRMLIAPVESQTVLGRVRSVARAPSGVAIVVALGGLIAIGSRPVAVPVDAVALLGQDIVLEGLTTDQLGALPSFDATGTEPVGAAERIAIGLARPSH